MSDDFARQVKAIAGSWCANEGHDFIRLEKDSPRPPDAPTIIIGGPVRWCRNCGLIEVIQDDDA